VKTTYSMLPGEYWWGGTSFEKYCPLTEKSVYDKDFRKQCDVQTSSYFVSNMGRYIWGEEPFAVHVENGVMEFEGGKVDLVVAGSTLREAYLHAQAAHFPCDKVKLKKEFFKTAQYNTWMEFTYYPTQEGVLNYAKEWLKRGFEPGIFIIDEGWHQNTAYGDWEFDFARFPDPKKMVDELHELGFIVMLWLVPLVSPNGPAFVRSLRPLIGTDPEMAKHLYMRNEKDEVAIVNWWNGTSAILDLSNPYDAKFLDDQLQHLMKDYGIDGFKFDGGTVQQYHDSNVINGKFMPSDKTAHDRNRAWNEFGRVYPFHEYKDTYNGGGRNCIQRLHDRFHSWTDHGITDIIPCAIVNGLIGHPFICPDMIGGGSWTTRWTPGFVADEELFVRMAQVSALFPMMQFSWAPWESLSEENVALCLEAAKLHKRLSDEIIELVEEAEENGEPIIRLLEYNDPHQGFVGIQDEFMLGTRFLVAPVVTKGTFVREVAFPEGKWMNEEGQVFEGRTRVMMDSPLHKLLWFRRVDE